jgi:hypothetical protein
VKNALALWTAAFEALPKPGLLVKPTGWVPGYAQLLDDNLDIVLPDVLNTIYGMPEPIPVVRLAESVWLACVEHVYFEVEPSTEPVWRDGVAVEFRRLLAKLAEFGAVELTVGPSDPMYTTDLVPENSELPPDVQDRLRGALDAPAVDLVTLTPLGARAVRARLLREGRVAPLVGDLAGAAPAPMLSALMDHYTSETAAAEMSGWLAAHGGREAGLPLLLDAIRESPFRTLASDMLEVLVSSLPDGDALIRDLRADPALGPIATRVLIDSGELDLGEVDDRERLLGMTEQFLVLLEATGPEGASEALSTLPDGELAGLREAILGSGHPDQVGLAELAEMFEQFAPSRKAHPLGGLARSRSVKAKKRRR